MYDSVDAFLVACNVLDAPQAAVETTMNGWWSSVRSTPQVFDAFQRIVGKTALEVAHVHPVCDTLIFAAFEGLRAEAGTEMNNLWLFTERKLNDYWPPLKLLGAGSTHRRKFLTTPAVDDEGDGDDDDDDEVHAAAAARSSEPRRSDRNASRTRCADRWICDRSGFTEPDDNHHRNTDYTDRGGRTCMCATPRGVFG